MDPAEFDRVASTFTAFHRRVARSFGRPEAQRRSEQYVRGLLVQDQERRSAENLAEAIEGAIPRGLAGDSIPLGARVLAVADAWDAMTSHRAYRRALELNTVRAKLDRGRGKQFDPLVLDAFLEVLAARPDLAVPHTEEIQESDSATFNPSVAPA